MLVYTMSCAATVKIIAHQILTVQKLFVRHANIFKKKKKNEKIFSSQTVSDKDWMQLGLSDHNVSFKCLVKANLTRERSLEW